MSYVRRQKVERNETVPASPVAGSILEYLRFDRGERTSEFESASRRINWQWVRRPALRGGSAEMSYTSKTATVYRRNQIHFLPASIKAGHKYPLPFVVNGLGAVKKRCPFCVNRQEKASYSGLQLIHPAMRVSWELYFPASPSEGSWR